jgi:antibiotic biosynthesis monooxygenase (ABM) superfamily enzyme
MTMISVDAEVVTLINVFEVAPEKQDALIEILEVATRETMRHLPGFVSANIHKSLDGSKVANYAQWKTVEDFQRMLLNKEAQAHMQQVIALAKASPVLYRVASVHP